MKPPIHCLLMLTILVASCFAPGCSENRAELEKQHAFRLFGFRYHQFFSAHQRAPNGLGEMEEYDARLFDQLSKDAEYVRQVFHSISTGEIVVIWNAAITNDAAANDQFILAYYANVAEQGGLILTGGGSVEKIKAAEFDLGNLFPETTHPASN